MALMMSNKLDEFLRFLAKIDDWHSLSEVAEAIGLSRESTKNIAFFFEEFDFIILDEEKRRVKVNPKVRKLYTGEEGEHAMENRFLGGGMEREGTG